MAWQIEFDDASNKDLAQLDRQMAKRITAFLRERVAVLDDPRSIGEALKGSRLGEFWKSPRRLPLIFFLKRQTSTPVKNTFTPQTPPP